MGRKRPRKAVSKRSQHTSQDTFPIPRGIRHPAQPFSLNAQMLTRKVVKIAVMNLQSDPLGIQRGPNRVAHVIWKLVTLLNEGNWATRKTVARCRLGARCRDPSQTSLSPSLHQPSNPSSQQHAPLSHLAPHHRTHCAPDSPAHDDLGAEGEGGVSPIAVADACGQNTGIATGVHKDVMHHRLVVVNELGLKLGGRWGGQSIVTILYVKSYSPCSPSPNKTAPIPCFSPIFFLFHFF